ncbi:MAG: hypothetical protein KAS90_00850 [Candidatus Aenigmarchaeota archaeon]|nr:hypothetical protein [Candidatus Aenigmarchaeota archaeon]
MIEFVMLLGLASVFAMMSLGFLSGLKDKYNNTIGKKQEVAEDAITYKGHIISPGMPYDEAKTLFKDIAREYLAAENKKKVIEKQIESVKSKFKEYAENETSQTMIRVNRERAVTKIHGYKLNIGLVNKQLEVLEGYGKLLGVIVKKHESANEAKIDTTPDLRKHVEPAHAPV